MKKKRVLKKAARSVLIAAAWLIIWEAAAHLVNLELLIPAPFSVLRAFTALLSESSFYVSCGKSLLRVISGWLIGIAAGMIIAVLTSLSKVLRAFFSPALHVIKATPVASFIILALVLMTSSRVPVFTGVLIVIPIIWANITEGIDAVNTDILEMADAFSMSRKNKLRYIYIPSLMPYFTAAATSSMGLAWKACIAAEVICNSRDSLGSGIYNAKVYLETPSLFAWTLAVILLSVLLEKVIKAVLRGTEAEK